MSITSSISNTIPHTCCQYLALYSIDKGLNSNRHFETAAGKIRKLISSIAYQISWGKSVQRPLRANYHYVAAQHAVLSWINPRTYAYNNW